ncbi:hypothetical protein HanIR_Chr02g0052491 [Helianthus annuus]|nr:hypothetical protein HanIR_Chr02g0052491 [Helianthus annuus]
MSVSRSMIWSATTTVNQWMMMMMIDDVGVPIFDVGVPIYDGVSGENHQPNTPPSASTVIAGHPHQPSMMMMMMMMIL